MHSLLQSKNFQSIKLNNLLRTKLIHLKKKINKKLFSKADPLRDKILSCSRIKLSNSQTIILDGVDTGVLISDFILYLRRKNADVPDFYFTLLDAAGIF